jgi:ATP-binding cassette, subfamily B (MDR/TAP), member 1
MEADQASADMGTGAKGIEEKVEEKQRKSADRGELNEQNAKELKRQSGGASSDSASDDLKKYDSKIVQLREVPQGDEALVHLPQHEREILKRQLDIPAVAVSFPKLFRYATKWDKIIIAISAFGAIAGGAALPLMTVRPKHFS